VAGLEAKPIIDILVGVRELDTAEACFGPLAGLGYLYAPYLPEEMHWFCKPDPAHRTHHLHLVPSVRRDSTTSSPSATASERRARCELSTV
jgi:GrpB-like predicted nucleotidyltransferase (UPF0157 family)